MAGKELQVTAIRSDVTAPSQRKFGFLERNPGLVPPLGLLGPLVLLIVLITVINRVFLDGLNRPGFSGGSFL